MRAELDDVMYEMEQDAKKEKAEVKAMQDTDKIHHEEHDIEKLKNLEDALGGEGLTTEDQDYAIMCEIRDIMRDLANDPKLNPATVTAKGLARKGLSDRVIDEEMKLKKIYDEVADGKPVDIKHLREEMDEIMYELAEDVQVQKSVRQITAIKDDIKIKTDDIKGLKDLENQ